MSQSAWLTSIQSPSSSLRPIPIGAPSKAARKRTSDSRSSAVFSASASSIATLERSTSGSTGLTM